MVDVDIEQVIQFCHNFEQGYINPSLDVVSDLKQAASSINSGLRGTAFATKSSEEVIGMANKLQQILDQGDIRIRELERKANDDLERGKAFTR